MAHIVFHFFEIKFSRRSKPVPYSIPECPQLLKEPPHDMFNKSHTFPLLWPLIKSLKVKATVKGKYVTCYICQVGALSKAEGILKWNMGLILTTARILFQRKISRCVSHPYSLSGLSHLLSKHLSRSHRLALALTGCT